MDFTATQRQEGLVARVDGAIEDCGGLERVRAFAFEKRLDTELERALAATIRPQELTLLERALVADRLAWAGAATTFGLQAVVLGGMAPECARPGLAIVDGSRSRLARYAGDAGALLVLDGDKARLVALSPGQVEPVPSGSGFPVGRAPAALLESGRLLSLVGLRPRWALAVAAEIGGTAHAVIELTSAHLRQREQFGRPLSHFQALRHRLANAAVDAEATRWMAREAAYSGQERSMWLAASYAASVGASLSPESVQLWGARGFAQEFAVSNLIMRLQGLRFELGSADRLAGNVIAAGTSADDTETAAAQLT